MSDIWRSNKLWPKFFRFALIGALSSVAYGVFTVLWVELIGLEPLPATILGYLLAIPLNFVLQRGFAFRVTKPNGSELPRFLVVHGASILFSILLMFIATDILHAHYRFGVLLTMISVPVLVFVVMNRWVFSVARIIERDPS